MKWFIGHATTSHRTEVCVVQGKDYNSAKATLGKFYGSGTSIDLDKDDFSKFKNAYNTAGGKSKVKFILDDKGKKLDIKNINEAYKVHYPSLKNLVQLQYTDPRVNTEGRKVHVEKEGNFHNGEQNVDGHYVVYEDAGFPGSYIGVHIGSELSEDGGDAPISVVAIDTSRSAVVNRVAYRARQSRISEAKAENNYTITEAKTLPEHKKIFQSWVAEILKNIRANPKYAKSLSLEKDQEKVLMISMVRIIGIMGDPGSTAHTRLKPILPKKYDETLVSNGDKNLYDSPWWSMTDDQRITIVKKGIK